MDSSNRITIDEQGFIKNLLRLGFTKNQSFSEIFTNSIDARSTKIVVQKNKNEIRIIDNGIGMNKEELQNKYNLMKQRKRDRDTTGCAGIGGTTSEFILARIKSIVITKKADSDEIFVAEVDWNRVYTEHKLFDSILFRPPTSEETEIFLAERDCPGTTTILYYAKEDESELTNLLDSQFDSKKKKDITHCERFDIIFGHKNCQFIYTHWKTKKDIILELYNLNKYREEDMNYKYKDYDIEIHKEINSGNIIYICDGRIIDVHGSTGKGKKTYKKTLTKYIKTCDTTKIGIIKLNLYNPYDENRFNINNPKLPGASQTLNNYETKFFRHDRETNAYVDREFIQEMQIYRNNHYLGIKNICNKGNSRGGGDSTNKLFYTRSFIEFFVESEEDEIEISPLDEIFGVQLNKNQNNKDNIPLPLGRLIEGLINEFHLEVWDYFQNTIKLFKRNNQIITKKNICDNLCTTSKLLIEGKFDTKFVSTINELTSCILDLDNYNELSHYINTLDTNKKKLSTKLINYKNACRTIEKIYCENKRPSIPVQDPESESDSEEKPKPESESELETEEKPKPKPKPESESELETEEELESESVKGAKHDHLINDAQMAWAMNESLDNGGATEEQESEQQVLMEDYISNIKIVLLEAKTKLNKEKYELLVNYNYNLN